MDPCKEACKQACKQEVLALARQYLDLEAENALRYRTSNESGEDSRIQAIGKAAAAAYESAQKTTEEKHVVPLDERSQLFRTWMKNPWDIYSSR